MKIRDKDKLSLISNMGTMLKAGIPLIECVETLMPDSPPAVKKFLDTLHSNLNDGKMISDSMATMPRSFDPITVNLVRAAEEAGTLEDTLTDIEESIKQQMAFKDELRASLVYPVFVSLVFVGVLLLLLIFVVPRISKVLAGLRTNVPPATQFLVSVSDFLIANYVTVIIVSTVIILAIIIAARVWKQRFVKVFYSFPLIASLTRSIDLFRLCRSISLMLHSGIPISEVLVNTKTVVHTKTVVNLVENMQRNVATGHALSYKLGESNRKIPPILVRLMQSAERSGQLEMTMQKLADYFQAQISRRLRTITTLMEPILIVVIGLATGAIMLAIIAPIYNLISNIRAR